MLLSSFLDIRFSQYLFSEETKRAIPVNFDWRIAEKRSKVTYNVKQPTDTIGLSINKDTVKPTINSKQANATDDLMRPAFPIFTTYEAMLEDDMQAPKSLSFARYTPCSYQGLRKPLLTTVFKKTELQKCRRTPLTPNDCAEMVKYFGPIREHESWAVQHQQCC